MTLREILHSKGHVVHTIGSGATLDDVVQKLVRNNCGSLVVCEDSGHPESASQGRMIGIITERDILKALATYRASLTTIRVSEVMSSKLVTGSPDDSVEDTMGLMTEMRIRHLPVTEGNQLLGLVSIGDVVKMQHNRLSLENHYLKSYLQG